MKVLVIGAAGKTGRAVVDRALEQGHEVTAFVHRVEGYNVQDVQVRAGDATDVATVGAAVSGQDAVINTVGGKTPYKHTTLEADVAAALLAAMQRNSVRRLITTSSVGVGESSANMPFFVKILQATFLRGAQADKTAMEAAVRDSDLDWVISRPAVLTDKPATGDIRVLPAHSRERANSLTRADLAAFLVAQLANDTHLRQAVTLANR